MFSGLLVEEHIKRIGTAIYEFLWCLDKITSEYTDENGEKRGRVLGGKPIDANEIAQRFGRHEDTVLKNLKKLSKEGYITTKRTPYGQIIEVMKSKKRVDQNADSRVDENADSLYRVDGLTDSSSDENTDSGVDRNADSEERVDQNADSRIGESTDSNKTLQLDIARKEKEAAALASLGIETTPPDFDGLLESVMVLMGRTRFSGKELDLMKSLLRAGVPTDTILTTLEEKLQEYAANNGGRYFSSFCYVEAPILAKHELNTTTAKLELVQGYAQTAAMRSPGVEPDPLEQKLRELMSS